MSLHVLRLVRESWLPPALRHTASVLADFADRDGGRIWPSVATVAARTGKSKRQIIYDLRKLEALGVLVVERRSVGGARAATQRYRLNLGALTPAMDCRGDEGDSDPIVTPPTPAIGDTDPCNLRHEPLQPIAADPLRDPSSDPSRTEHAREARGFPLSADARRRQATAPADDGNEGVLTARALRLMRTGHYANPHGLRIEIRDEGDLFAGLKACALAESITLDALPVARLRGITEWVWRISERQGEQP